MNIFALAGLMTAIAAVAAVFGAYRRKLRRVQQRVRERSEIAETRMGPIEYGVTGSGEPALVIHGAGGGYDQGLLIAESFPQFRVIAPSRFGYLRTPVPADPSSATQAHAHAALLDHLGVSRALVAGASAGAPSAVELALRHPERVRALILMVPRAYVPDRTVEVPASKWNALITRIIMSGADFLYWAALLLAPKKVMQFMGVPPKVQENAPASERERLAAILESVMPLSLRTAGLEVDAATRPEPLPLGQIEVPTLIITTRDDLFGTLPAAEFMAQRIPNARLVVLDDGGHLLIGQQREVTDTIADFLASVEKAEQCLKSVR